MRPFFDGSDPKRQEGIRITKSDGQLEASIADLEQRGGGLQTSHCGPERRLCVAVDDYAGVYGKAGDYRIAKGY
jgi:hypothetical protein